ncbi:MAG: hypothetical protein IT365_08820 [Candidatus Hydrogenedentes bacterium]|nr:hypothetical protein [Candidatus Hydrogenedentota bacterium]
MGWWQIYPEYLTDVTVGQCPSAGRTALYAQTDFTAARNIMAACSAVVTTEANTLRDTENPCFGKDPSHGLNGNAARDGVNCDVTPNACTPYPHTDIAKQGYTDMRAYYYTGFFIPSSQMGKPGASGLADHAAIGNYMQNRTSGYPSAPTETHMRWDNRNDSMTYTLPSGGSVTIARLREGIERFAITDINNPAGSATAQSDTIVSWDENRAFEGGGGGLDSPPRFNHLPGGVNILYMDGHVEFGKFRTTGSHQWVVNEHSFLKPDASWPKPDFP